MQMIPNLCVREGGKLNNMGEPQKPFFFFRYTRYPGLRNRGHRTAPRVLHPRRTQPIYIYNSHWGGCQTSIH